MTTTNTPEDQLLDRLARTGVPAEQLRWLDAFEACPSIPTPWYLVVAGEIIAKEKLYEAAKVRWTDPDRATELLSESDYAYCQGLGLKGGMEQVWPILTKDVGWELTGRMIFRLDAYLCVSIWDDDGGMDGTDLTMSPNWGDDDPDGKDWTFVDVGDWDGRFPGDPAPVKS